MSRRRRPQSYRVSRKQTKSRTRNHKLETSHKPVKRLAVTTILVMAIALIAIVGGSPIGIRLLRAAYANNTAQTPPFTQDWTNTVLITTDNDWSAVPGIIGYRGDGLASATGVDPQTILSESTVVNVLANQTNPNTVATGAVAEFQLANPTIALQGSGTARAPYVQLHLNTTGLSGINVSYNLRDIDGSTDNAVQPVALQYRVGSTGNFTNIPAAFVADATEGPSLATKVTPVSAALPAAVNNQPLVQVRIITSDAVGSDEWVGIDDINVTGGAGDSAPSITTTVPANGATGVTANSNLSITFNENVNVTGNWFQISCATSGLRNVADTVVSGGPQTLSIDPSADFVAGELCTATVFASQVTDQDVDDPPDNMVADATFSFTIATPDAVAGSVVISQIYGGGGNAGASIKNDFIELINHTGAPISLNGWSVQYTSAAGTTWQVTPLTNFTIAAGQYYLIQEAAGSGGTIDLVPDATGTIAMGAAAGKVALVSNTTPLSGACPTGVVDLVGFGATSCFEGTGSTPAPSNTTAVLRKSNGCTDTDNNANDFVTGAPAPRNSSSATNNCAVLSGTGSANPLGVQPGDSSTLTVNVSPGSNPTSTGTTVSADLTSIGGLPAQPFAANGNVFTFVATVAVGTTPGTKNLPVTISDAQGRTATTTIPLTVQQPHVVISQLYGGGGNTGATYANDYVELYNPSGITFDLTGWSLQYTSSAGDGWEFTRQPIGGTIAPGQYYLISLGSGNLGGAALPAANILGDINMSGTTGKVALVSNFEPLDGTCPLGDTDIVDFVGYGSGANCSETANAPAPSNTTAIFRTNGGATDTDNNLVDFVVATPNPRRTAPIVEIGPAVFGTDPRNNGFNAPRDASLAITFTEPVNVSGNWFNISCASTGLHNDATVAGSGKVYVITPNVNFLADEQCTATIFKDQIHDVDADDSDPNSDTLTVDYVWTFRVSTGTAPPYPPDVHLTMGNPNGATADINQPNNYLMEKPEFAVSYNRDKGGPNWVSWHLSDEWVGSLVRVDSFRPDPAVPPTWYRVQATDFSGTGFDRGHMTPNADRDKETSIPINQATFLMSNMVAQAPDNNQGPWAELENFLRTLLPANELYIVSGPVGIGGISDNGPANTIANGHVTVPSATWKVVLVLPKGTNDISRVTAGSRTIAVRMPNIQGIRNNPWQTYLTTVDAIEDETGYNFFSNVPDAIENAIEAGMNGVNPPGTEGQTVTTDEDMSKSITLTAASPNPLTYTIVSSPTHGSLTGSDANRTYIPNLNFNGIDSFTFKVNDGSSDSNVSTVNITINPLNDTPTANGQATSTGGNTPVAITLTGSDIETSAASLSFNVASGPTHGTLSGSAPNLTYTPALNYAGPDSFTFTVTDTGDGSSPALSSGEATVSIFVNDTIAPTIVLKGNTISLRPPNHNYQTINVSDLVASAGDNFDPSVNLNKVVISKVTSDEAENGSNSGNTLNDIVIGPNCKSVQLRAERETSGDGRVYTIFFSVKDASGNTTTSTAKVLVLNGNNGPIDSGPHYTVLGSCP